MNHPSNKTVLELSNSDFQCLQDQLVDLRTKNYELAETNRKQLNDFEIAKTKIVQLQQQLEEQERDFQVTSSTLRQEIDHISKDRDEDDYKQKAQELQVRYEESIEKIQSLEKRLRDVEEKDSDLEKENDKLKKLSDDYKKEIDTYIKLIDSLKGEQTEKIKTLEKSHHEQITTLNEKCLNIEKENESLKSEISKFDEKTNAQIEERKIHEKKGIRLVKELKRQLIVERGRAEMLQKRLQELLSSSITVGSDVDCTILTNVNTSEGHINNVTDTSSVGSWSFMPGRTQTNVTNLTESVSLCSIDSEDRETVQISTDNLSEPSSSHRASTSSSKQGSPLSTKTTSTIQKVKSDNATDKPIPSASGSSDLLLEDQANLVDRITKLQQEKWILEEKLNYLELSNLSLSEDLAKKSEIIKHYCMNNGRTKAPTPMPGNHMLSTSTDPNGQYTNKHSINLFTASSQNNKHNNNNIDKLSVKKVVEFLKDRSLSGNDLENLREATKRMQLMLEETLTKNLHLQNSLDLVSAELEEIKSKLKAQQ